MLTTVSVQPLADRNFRQTNILHDGPDDSQATGFCRESIDLIGALPHIAKEAFNRVGAANVAMHDRWKGIKGQHMLFILAQAANSFWIALLVFGLEGRQIEQGIFFFLLLKDSCQFCCHLLPLPVGNGVHDVALFVDQAALTGRRGEQGGNRRQQSIMPIGDNQINFSHSTSTQILDEATAA